MKLVFLILTLTLSINFSECVEDDKFQSLLKQFDIYAEEQRKAWQIPGMAIGIVKDGQLVFAKGYGQRGLSDHEPVDEHTIFQIGSLSKAFTSALVAHEIDKGTLKWEDKVIDHWPEFRLKDPWVTDEFHINDLLSQRSGLPPYAGDGQAYLGFSSDEMLKNMKFLTPISSFRASYAYQNIFFLVAAKILEIRTKKTFGELLKNEIFSPLKMDSSSSTLEDYLKAKNRAQLHMRVKGSTLLVKDDVPAKNAVYLLGPAGGINSNIIDYSKWLIFQANQGLVQNKQLITKENMQKMITPMIHVGDFYNRSFFSALGWVYMSYSPYPLIWHDGGTLGAYSFAGFIPQEKLGIIIFSNVKYTFLSRALALEFFDMYYGKEKKDWSQFFLQKMLEEEKTSLDTPSNSSPPLQLSSYAGEYTNPIYGKTIISVEEDHLLLKFDRAPQQFILKHWDRDIFTTVWPYVEPKEFKVNFTVNDKGLVASMNISLFIEEGSGTFTRVGNGVKLL